MFGFNFCFIAILVFILLLAVLIIFLSKKNEPTWKSKVKSKLTLINSRSSDNKLKLLELDKLLEFTLQNKFSSDSSLGSILKQKAKQIPKQELDQIWLAHKMRNKISHDIDYNPNSSQLLINQKNLTKFIIKHSQ
ncbi:MAG: hypothetical protein AAGF07_03220 [Patescibacteria group bacterium]